MGSFGEKKSQADDLHQSVTSQSVQQGLSKAVVETDTAIQDFYGDSINEAYRLKSELVAKHISEIGQGK